MIELPLVFLGGLLGSAHCVGMCGGFALVIGSRARGAAGNVGRQAVYSLGRIFTYAVFGATVGYAGLRLTELATLVNVQAVLAIVAGVLLIVQGLLSAGVLRARLIYALVGGTGGSAAVAPYRAAPALCPAGGMLGTFLRSGALSHVFLAGMITGFLPCGLVYAYVALATSAGDMLGGAVTMAAFGAGTVPAMILTGSGASLVSLAGRRRMLRVAAWCVVLVGAISLARGFGFLELPGWHSPGGCPACADQTAGL
jgi:sulfite exporter TauE/SafE